MKEYVYYDDFDCTESCEIVLLHVIAAETIEDAYKALVGYGLDSYSSDALAEEYPYSGEGLSDRELTKAKRGWLKYRAKLRDEEDAIKRNFTNNVHEVPGIDIEGNPRVIANITLKERFI